MLGASGSQQDGDERSPRPRSAGRWGMAAVAAVVLLAGAVVAVVQLSGDDPPSSSPATSADTSQGGVTTTVPDVTEPPPGGDALPVGEVTEVGTSTQREKCPLDTCLDLTVKCPDLPDTVAVLAVTEAGGPARGFIAFFSGGPGRAWWANEGNQADADVLAEMGDAGLEVSMVRWVDGWARSPIGEAPGFASVACRPATVVKWLHDERYSPMGLTPAPGTCGFCISGNSGGSSQAAYSLTHYGLDTLVDAAILSSGPPHAALAKGCLNLPGEEAYWFDANNIREIDSAYGGGAAGPCARHDPAMASQWESDGVDTGGSDYTFDTTRIAFILGSADPTIAPAHARDLVAKLRASGSPWVTEVTAVDMPHGVTSSPDGRKQLVDAVLGAP